MGNLFSTTPSQSAQEYEANKKKLLAEQQLLQKEIDQASHDNVQILNSQFLRQKQVAKKRIEEIKYTIERAKELKEARKQLNIRVAVLLCAIYYNYPFGTLDVSASDEPDDGIVGDNTWQSNATSILNIGLTVDVFWTLCKIPQLLPLLWPTGNTPIEDKFHVYKYRDSAGNPDPIQYILEVCLIM